MKVANFSRNAIKTYEFERSHIVITLNDPDSPPHELPENPARKGHLVIPVWDLDRELPSIKEGYFHPAHAREVVQFVKQHMPVSAIFTACEAGISRSSAVAAALAKVLTWDDVRFFKQFHPNRRIYSMILAEAYKEGL